ncbi:DUF6119 family protein [Hahella sp. NBU794]|uniref:DUF6119 family protein n=1 Tax=Hahella sp. NBU794 TaxID=3422590 RepID=UPI003D6DEFC5
MPNEIAKISFFLAKEKEGFESVIDKDKQRELTKSIESRHFKTNVAEAVFYFIKTSSETYEDPPWLSFINEKIENQIHFSTSSKRASGLLLLKVSNRLLAATFGTKGSVLLKKERLVSDFGIITAMNMCGSGELRQTKSSTHTATTKHIDRHLSRPSDSFEFGMDESEHLQFISAHLENNKNITLQGKDSLTLKVIGDSKLTWEKLISHAEEFIIEYKSENYKISFPNYLNIEEVPTPLSNELDEILCQKIKNEDYSNIHLSIPEFIQDDEFSYSYTNNKKRENNIYSHICIEHLIKEKLLSKDRFTIKTLKNKHIYAYSHFDERILSYKKWSYYSCIIAELVHKDRHYILSSGVWKKFDSDFYNMVNDFVNKKITVEKTDNTYNNIYIFEKKKNRESVFNSEYCKINKKAILFDQAKLGIGTGIKNKEFCDILEYVEGSGLINIVHVKRYENANSLIYLFSQAKFYCEFFLSDETFLIDIRNHIIDYKPENLEKYLSIIKDNQEQINGKDYNIKLWLLYSKGSPIPQKENIPIMAKYELKLAYDRLRKVHKYNSIALSFIPVITTNHKEAKSTT